VYGWGFSVTVPQTGKLAHRNSHFLGLIGFGNAYLLTGDDRYLDPWRKMIDKINGQSRVVDGRTVYPHMYGDHGWYDFTPEKYRQGAEDIWYWSMTDADRSRLPDEDWLAYLAGKAPTFPEEALRRDFAAVRQKVAAMRADPTTPDTRLADDPLKFNPATVGTLVRLMLGGPPTNNRSLALHCRVRYFDADRRRAGLPADVAALVEKLTADATELTLVNVNQLQARTVTIQAGAYGEHRFTRATVDGKTRPVGEPYLTVRLEPGAGARLVLGTKRYANAPTLARPWDRAWWPGE
jgi:hypothetical protein